MTRKDYERLARTIALTPDFGSPELTADVIADTLTLAFPNFNQAKFFARIAELSGGKIQPTGLDHDPPAE